MTEKRPRKKPPKKPTWETTSLQQQKTERLRLGQILVDLGFLTEDQLRGVLEKVTRGITSIGQVALSQGLITEPQLLSARAVEHSLEVVDLTNDRPDRRAVELVPQLMAETYQVLPWRLEGRSLTVVLSDPTHTSPLADIRELLALEQVQAVLAPQKQILETSFSAYQFDDDWYAQRELLDEESFHQYLPATVRRSLWPRIFISYRRKDTEFQAHAIHEVLTKRFGSDVFIDVDAIPAGVDFPDFLADTISRCDIVLALIGYHWVGAKSESGNFRLHEPGDFVRIEIESALSRKIPVIPVLLGEVKDPQKHELPRELHELTNRNNVRIRARTFRHDLSKLVDAITYSLESSGSAESVSQAHIDLGKYRFQQAAIERVPAPFARKYNVIPILQTADTLFIATADQHDPTIFHRLKHFVNSQMIAIPCNPDDIRDAIARHYEFDEE